MSFTTGDLLLRCITFSAAGSFVVPSALSWLQSISLWELRMDFMTQPTSWAARTAEGFTRIFQEAPMAPVFAATQMDTVTTAVGTVWVRPIYDFTRPTVVILKKRHSMQQVQSWFTAWAASSIKFVFFVTLVTFLRATSRVRAVFTRYTAKPCPRSADATTGCCHP